MKQTNNAIKFLMAQYRAIFKSAYFKGLATAAVVTMGLAAGAAQASSGYLQVSNNWSRVDTDGIEITGSGVLAGNIAGDQLSTDDLDITNNNKTSDTASGGTLVIGNYDPNGSAMGTGSMKSGAAAGNWVSSTDSDARAIGGLVTVNGSGYVDKGGQSGRGVIYGARAYSTNGYAEAIGNEVHVKKDEVALNKAAASETIYGARVQGNTGALGSENKVFIDGRSATARQVVSMSGDGLFGVQVRASGASSTGEYEASSNEVILNYIDVNDASNTLAIRGGHVRLAGSSGTGIADSNYIELNNSKISASGGMVYANHVTNGASNSTISLNGNGRGVSISDTTIYNAAESDFLAIAANTVEGSGGVVTASNGRVELANTKITASGGTNVTVYGSNIVVSGAANANLTASNNVVNITEADADSNNSINASVVGAHVENTTDSDKLTLAASNNSVSIGENVEVAGEIFAARFAASGADVTSLTANNNSVSIAGTVKNTVAAVQVATKDTAKVSGSTSFLNNDINLLAGANVSVGSLFGGEGKDSVISIADGSTYVVNTTVDGENNTQSIISDVINIDGTVDVHSGKSLNIVGFVDGGVLVKDAKYNKNLTTVGSTAVIENAGTINVFGKVVVEQGATLTAETAGAGIVIDGDSTKHSNKDLKDNAVEGAGYGTLVISSGQLESYLTKDVVLDQTREDSAGGVVLTSGGRLEFSDATDLSDFSFVSGSTATGGAIAVAGNIVDTTNKIYGDNLTVSQKLTDLTGKPVNALNLQVIAKNLTLGDGTKDGLWQLNGSGIEKLEIDQNLTINVADTTDTNNGYFLLNNGDSSNVSFLNTDKDVTGTVNGNLEFAITAPVKVRGNWDFRGNWKLDAGTNQHGIAIGGQNNPSDTYVTLDGALINNVTAQNAWTSVIVNSYKKDKEGNTLANDYHAVLDLTSATLSSTESVNPSSLLGLYASTNGTIKMTGAQLESVLEGDKAKGFALYAIDNGVLSVNSSITGEYNFDKFQAKPEGSDGDMFTHRVTFDNGGVLDINGDLSLYTGKNDDGSAATPIALNIGGGTIKADIITLTNYAEDKTGKALDTTVSAGTLEVSEGLVVRNSEKLILGDGTQIANVVLDSDSYSLGGSVSVKNLDIKAGSSLQVKTGTWSSEGDIYTTGANGFVVGYAYNDQATTDEDKAANKFLSDAKEQGLLVAQFTGDNFNATSAGNVITVHDASKATFNTMQLADGSEVNLNGGHLLINGLNVTKPADAAKTDTNPAYVNLDKSGTSTTAGIAFNKANIHVTGAGAVMEFGNLATNALVDLDGDANDANKDGSKIAITTGGINEANFYVDDFGELKFNFNEGTKLSTDDIDALLNAFNMTDTNTNGYLNLGNSDLGLNITQNDEGKLQIAWKDLADYVNVIGSNFTTEQLKKSLVYGIPAADQVKGHYGALSVDVSSTGTTQVGVNGPMSLNNAADFGNYFVINSKTGTELGLKLGNGASLALVNGGVIGSITGSGQAMAGSQNDVTIYNEDGISAVTTINSTVDNQGIVGVDTLKVQSATEVKGNVEVETLKLESTLTTLGEKDTVHVNGGYITDNAVLTTYGFEIGNANNNSNDNTDGYGNVVVLGSLTATNNITMHEAGELGVFDGTVSTADLTMNKGGTLYVGYDPDSFVTNDDESTIVADNKSYSGEFEATGVTTLNGGYVFVDPIYGQNTALVSLDDLKGATAESDKTLVAGTLDGSAFVGQNAALGIGSANLATLKDKIARFQHNGSLNVDEVGSVLYVGKAFTLGADQSIFMTAQSQEDFLKYYNENNAATATDFTLFGLDRNGEHVDGDDPRLANTLYLGDNTAILVDAGVAANADTGRTNYTAIITFAGSTAGSTGSVIADGECHYHLPRWF